MQQLQHTQLLAFRVECILQSLLNRQQPVQPMQQHNVHKGHSRVKTSRTIRQIEVAT